MFEVLRKSLAVGVVTSRYPATPAEVSARARGGPELPFQNWADARPAAAACPTGAISISEAGAERRVRFDLGKCTFCGDCAEADATIRMTNRIELACRRRQALVWEARYALDAQGIQSRLVDLKSGDPVVPDGKVTAVGDALREKVHRLFGRSLHIREVDAGSCNGCEIEIVGLNSPIYDLERFGLHFVASPRHADLLLVTGPVTRNMELALRKTYEATPDPRLVVAVGACGCSGGIFGVNYATVGAVDAVIPVDVYVPGCPPNPHALLHGILTAIGRVGSA
jgi:Ni,Fe-hydrogenase III small subunit